MKLTDHLTRVVSRGRTFIPEVDGLRFVAITAVVLYHIRDFTPGHAVAFSEIHPLDSLFSMFLSIGHYGVQLFFILSGFLLAMPFAKWRLGFGAKPSLRKYYGRRLSRLEPPYLLAMIFLFLAGIAAHALSPGASKWTGISNWPNLLASLTYQHNLIYGVQSLITPVVWSLEIEVQFYLLAPLLAAPFSIRNTVVRRGLFVSLIVALPLLRELLPLWLGSRFNSLPWHLEFFVAGFLLADLFLVDWREAPSRKISWDTASLLGWPALIAIMFAPKLSWLLAPAALLCYVGAFRGKISSWVLSRPELTVIGGMCYSIYLLHYTVIMAASSFTRKIALHSWFSTRFGFNALITLPLILLVSVVFFVLLEQPCMDSSWPSRIFKRFGQVSALFPQPETSGELLFPQPAGSSEPVGVLANESGAESQAPARRRKKSRELA
jgi:peptidoglycan/LPS O-acetylase OafA/YrhL